MTYEQLSLFTDEELGISEYTGPKKIEKTVAIQMAELREQIAKDIEDAQKRFVDATPEEERQEAFLCGLGVFVTAAAIVRGHF